MHMNRKNGKWRKIEELNGTVSKMNKRIKELLGNNRDYMSDKNIYLSKSFSEYIHLQC